MANTLLEVLNGNNEKVNSEIELARYDLTDEQIKDFKKCEVKKSVSKNGGAFFYIETREGLWVFLPKDWEFNPKLESGDCIVLYKRGRYKYFSIERM